jgi:hypothetical protein
MHPDFQVPATVINLDPDVRIRQKSGGFQPTDFILAQITIN